MKYIMTLRSLAAVSVVLVAGLGAAARGQGTQPDFSTVEIKTTKISNNLYTLEGRGGIVGVLAGPDGVLLVDSQFAPLTQKLAAAVKQISSAPIRFLINTHLHGDHVGGNENFSKMGATVVAREELRWRLAHPSPAADGSRVVPAASAALPMLTYREALTLHINGEEVSAIPIPRAHTDGDTLVRFRNADVLMTGDYFRSIGYPFIDRANGGTLDGLLEGLGTTIGLAGPNTKIIPGHGPVVDRTAVTAHRDMVLIVRDRVAKLVDEGKTEAEVIAAKVTADYDGKIQQATQQNADRFVGGVYAELKAAK